MRHCSQGLLLGLLLGGGAIALGAAIPIGGAIAFPSGAIAQTVPDRQPDGIGEVVGDVKHLLDVGKKHYRRAEFKQAIAAYQQVLAKATQDKSRDAHLEALLYLLEIDLANGQYLPAEVKIQQVLKLAQQVGNRARESEALAGLSALHRLQGNYSIALENARKAVTLAQQSGDRRVEARSQFMLGIALYFQPDYVQALEALQQAVNLAKANQDQDEIAFIFNWIALTQAAMKDVSLAEKTIQQQQQISRDIEFKLAEYYGFLVTASIQQGKQQPEQVLQAYQRALTIAQSADNPWFQRSTLLEVGWLYVNQKQLPKALEFYQKALAIAKIIDDASVADVQNRMGVAHYQSKQYSEALAIFQQALNTYQQADRQAETIQVLINIGDTYGKQQQYPQAVAAYQQARAIARKLSDRVRELDSILSEGIHYVGQAQSLIKAGAYKEAIPVFDAAIPILKETQAIARDLQKVEEERLAIGEIEIAYRGRGFALSSQQQYPQAVAAFEQDLTFWRQHHDRLNQDTFLKEEQAILSTLAGSYSNNGQYTQAITAYQKALLIAEQRNEVKDQLQLLGLIAGTYNRIGEYSRALEISQQQLTLARTKLKQDSRAELSALLRVGQAYDNLGKTDTGLEYYQQALTIARSLKQQDDEATLLNNIGGVYQRQGEYLKALEPLQQVLNIRQRAIQQLQSGEAQSVEQLCSTNTASLGAEGRRSCLERFHMGVTATLNNLAQSYHGLGRYNEALQTHEQALKLALQYKNLGQQTTVLNNIGTVYLSMGDYPRALEYFQKSLDIAIATDARPQQSSTLNNIGQVHLTQGQSAKALDYFQQSLTLAKAMQAANLEATALLNIGYVYSDRGEYERALEFYQQALAISRSQNLSSITILNNIASVYSSQGNYSQALEQYQQVLELARKTGDRPSEVLLLRNIGGMHHRQASYAKALEFYQQARTVSQSIGSRSSELSDLLVQASFYRDLGQYPQALDFYQQTLALSRALGERDSEIIATGNIGAVYRKQAQYSQAIEWYQRALELLQETGDIAGRNAILIRLAQTHEKQGKLTEAEAILQQVLSFNRLIGARPNEAITLHILGRVYTSQGKVVEAQESLQQALVIAQSVRDRATEAEVLTDLGRLYEAQPELAVIFYKQSVNAYELIRQNLRSLSPDQQQSYTQTVAGTYRRLADILLQQNRILEAQQVLDLLKVQELDNYLRGVSRGANTSISLRPAEQTLIDRFNTNQTQLISLGNELTSLEKIPPTQRSQPQKDRILDLRKLQATALQTITTFFDSPDIKTLIHQLRTTTGANNLELSQLQALRNNLAKLSPSTVLLYPLILDDRLELILVTPNAPPIRRTVPVKRVDLNRAIATYRTALRDPTSDPIPPAQTLYNWLIKPIETDLAQARSNSPNSPQTLLYAPDGALRYIPIAALHDGKQWLAERLQINNITAASLDDLTTQTNRKSPKILAAAFSQGQYQIQTSQRNLSFAGLPYAGLEVASLAQLIPQTETRLNQQFNANLIYDMNDYNIVHLATHASFTSGPPEDSFILFGDGSRATLTDLKSWNIPNVDLIVLSACETALGDTLGNGEEILGFGYLMQKAGAKAAIASLWQVDDSGTQTLMNTFYAGLQQGQSKAKALQQAQQTLISGDFPYSHPYYWAPFILIGNGL